MKAKHFGLLVLQGAATVLAKPSEPQMLRDQNDLFRLAELAYVEAEKVANSNTVDKRGCKEICSWDKIRIRREWCVDRCSPFVQRS